LSRVGCKQRCDAGLLGKAVMRVDGLAMPEL